MTPLTQPTFFGPFLPQPLHLLRYKTVVIQWDSCMKTSCRISTDLHACITHVDMQYIHFHLPYYVFLISMRKKVANLRHIRRSFLDYLSGLASSLLTKRNVGSGNEIEVALIGIGNTRLNTERRVNNFALAKRTFWQEIIELTHSPESHINALPEYLHDYAAFS